MSFLGGAECSTGSNPLNQFTKHVQDDKSLQHDRLAGSGSAGLLESFRSQRDGSNQDDMMRDFLQQNGKLPQESMQPFAMDHLRRDLEAYQSSSPRPASPSWAAGFDTAAQSRMEAAFQPPKTGGFDSAEISGAEYRRLSSTDAKRMEVMRPPGLHVPASMIGGYQRPIGIGYGANMGLIGPVPYQRQRPSEVAAMAKGKGRMVELDDKNWERQFAEIDQAGPLAADAEANEAIEVELNHLDRSVLSALSETNEFGDFESLWRGISAETAAERQLLGEDDEPLDLSDLPLSNLTAWDGFDSQFQDGLRDPQMRNYLFEQDNLFGSAKDPFNEGLKIMKEGGNLSLAALAFEAAVQQDPQHVPAWSQLGSAQAQNEKESPAIRALEQALKLDPQNLSALMGLAISYTNEGYDTTAYRTLERWLSIKYPQIISPDALTPETDFGFTDRHRLHDKVTRLFIRAAQLSPRGEAMDPDVQVGLGVLFYGAEEHAKAVDCFEAALASTESGSTNDPTQAHLLWNRLGATLANSGRSEEAIAAYERALSLNPNFVRARYNLGVSCINIGCFEEAAQHLLGALSMHRVVEREGMERVKEVIGTDGEQGAGSVGDSEVERMVGMNQSTNLIETLRRVFGSLGRRDLAEKVEVGMNVDIFRGEFEF